jgi:hypothetical protein
MRKAKGAVLSILLLVFALSALAGVTGLWTGLTDGDHGASGSGRSATGGQGPDPGFHRIIEPASIVVLSGGLVFLGLYAKLRRAK